MKPTSALITGSAIRLGKHIAFALAEQGINIAVHYNSSRDEAEQTASELKSLGVKVALIQANLSDPVAASRELFQQANKQLGPVDLLINSAAIFNASHLHDLTEENFDSHLTINLKAPTFLSQEFQKQLPPNHQGHIINLLDWRARKSDPNYLAYSLSKAALWSLTEILALELAPNTRVNALSLGPMLAPEPKPADYEQRIRENVPLQTPGSPEDVTQAILFLINAPYITGTILPITGGEHL
ncbi:SDR family oxidoreductase [Lacunimicrobium album]